MLQVLPLLWLISGFVVVFGEVREILGDVDCLSLEELWGSTDCSSLSKQCIAFYPPSAFAKVNQQCIRSISVDAISGLTSDQFAQIPPINIQAFSKEQVQAWDSSVFTAFSGNRTYYLSFDACAGISAQDLANIPDSSMAYFQVYCWENIPTSSMANLSASQVSSIGRQAMTGFQPNQLAALPSSLCGAFSCSQLTSINPGACSGLSLECVNAMQIDAFSVLNSYCFHYAPDDLFSQLDENYFVNIGCYGISGVNAQKFQNAINHLGKDVVDKLDPKILKRVHSSTINDFINRFWGSSANMRSQSWRSICSQPKGELSWLKVVYSSGKSASCLESRFDLFDKPANISSNLFAALRAGHARHIPLSFFHSSPRLSQFSDSFLSALSSNQVAAIYPSALYGFDKAEMLQVNGSLQSLSPLQLSARYNSSGSPSFNCQVISNLSIYQLEFFSSDWCRNHSGCYFDGTVQQCSHQSLARSFDVKFSSAQQGICNIDGEYLYLIDSADMYCEEENPVDKPKSRGVNAAVLASAITIPLVIMVGFLELWNCKDKLRVNSRLYV
jgi:hypothetical protein